MSKHSKKSLGGDRGHNRGFNFYYMRIKRRAFNLIRSDDENTMADKIIEGFIIALIIVNVLLIVLDTFDNFSSEVRSMFERIEVFTAVIFTIEYLIRLWTADLLYPHLKPAKARLKYVFSFLAIIDLLALLPIYLPYIFPIDLIVLRMIRLLRLFEIFKANRITNALSIVGRVIRGKAEQLISSFIVIFVLMFIASILMFYAEHDAQPGVFVNGFSAIWWTFSTMTNADYGSIYPITFFGKILNALFSMMSIALFAVPTGIISSGFMEQLATEKELELEKADKPYCPHCGKHLE